MIWLKYLLRLIIGDQMLHSLIVTPQVDYDHFVLTAFNGIPSAKLLLFGYTHHSMSGVLIDFDAIDPSSDRDSLDLSKSLSFSVHLKYSKMTIATTTDDQIGISRACNSRYPIWL